jgi:hypothetical protein
MARANVSHIRHNDDLDAVMFSLEFNGVHYRVAVSDEALEHAFPPCATPTAKIDAFQRNSKVIVKKALAAARTTQKDGLILLTSSMFR